MVFGVRLLPLFDRCWSADFALTPDLRTLCLVNVMMSWTTTFFNKSYLSDVFPSVNTLILIDCWIHQLSPSSIATVPFPSLTCLRISNARASVRGGSEQSDLITLLYRPQMLHLSTDNDQHLELCPKLKSLTLNPRATTRFNNPTAINGDLILKVFHLENLEELRIEVKHQNEDRRCDAVATRWLIALLRSRSATSQNLNMLRMVFAPRHWKEPVRSLVRYSGDERAWVEEVHELRSLCQQARVRLVWEDKVFGDASRDSRVIERFAEQCEMAGRREAECRVDEGAAL